MQPRKPLTRHHRHHHHLQAGALDILGGPNDATSAHDVKSAKRTPLVFHDSLRKPEAERPFNVASLTASEEGSIDYVRASTQAHGAKKVDGRDVSIFFKNGAVAELLTILANCVPSLCKLAEASAAERSLAVGLLKHYVLAHVVLEVPHLRSQGLWKPSSSTHSGEKIYRYVNAQWDAQLYEQKEPDDFAKMRALAQEERAKGNAAMVAAAMADSVW